MTEKYTLDNLTPEITADFERVRDTLFEHVRQRKADPDVALHAFKNLNPDAKVVIATGPKAAGDGAVVEWHVGWLATYAHHHTVSRHFPGVYTKEQIAKTEDVLMLAMNCVLALRAEDGVVHVIPSCETYWTDDRFEIDPTDPSGGRRVSPVLHHPTGPSVRFDDNSTLYHWRGTRVPKDWIRKGPPIEAALNHKNLELRRCAAEIIGWGKILEHYNPRVINADDPEIGTLLEVDLPDAGPTRFIKVRCGTGRTFALCVPNEMKTALEANAWTYGLKAEDYKLEIRT